MSKSAVKAAFEKVSAGAQASPAAARVIFTSRVELKEGMLCEVKVRQTPLLTVDEPPSFGGTDQGMNPVELALSALGACQTLTFSAFAAVAGIPLDAVRVRVRGHLDVRGLLGIDPSVPAGCGRVEFATEIDSPADEATIRKLVDRVERGCPVLDMFTRPVPVTGTVSLNGRALSDVARAT